MTALRAARALLILQARMGSTRLPGKVLAPIAGRSLLSHCILRLQAGDLGPVIVATSTNAEDDAVDAEARRHGAAVVRGPALDVLARFALVLDRWDLPLVIRATADNPAVDMDAAARVVEHLGAGADYVVEAGLPVGAAVEGVRSALLKLADAGTRDGDDREHVTPFVRRQQGRFRVVFPEAPSALRRPDLRFTVDTPADLLYMRRVFAAAGTGVANVPLVELIAAADRLAAGESS